MVIKKFKQGLSPNFAQSFSTRAGYPPTLASSGAITWLNWGGANLLWHLYLACEEGRRFLPSPLAIYLLLQYFGTLGCGGVFLILTTILNTSDKFLSWFLVLVVRTAGVLFTPRTNFSSPYLLVTLCVHSWANLLWHFGVLQLHIYPVLGKSPLAFGVFQLLFIP